MIPIRLSELSRVLDCEYQGEDILLTHICHDSRQIKPGDTYLAIRGEQFDGHQFCQKAWQQGATSLIVESPQPELSVAQLIVPDATKALGQIAAHNRRQVSAITIAITGSSGKSTVKQMLLAICRQAGKTRATQGNLNNHIGVPLTLLGLDSSDQYAVVELGANHIGEIAYTVALSQPDIALVNNVSAAHLEGFGSLAGVIQAKGEIYQGLGEKGVAIVNADLDCLPDWQPELQNRAQISYSMKPFADVYARNIVLNEALCASFEWVYRGQSYPVELPAAGLHNVKNALAAIACALAAKISPDQICHGLNQMELMDGRGKSYQLGPLRLIDDSYNANEGSVKAAIDLLDAAEGESIFVLGELAEMGEYAESVAIDIQQYLSAKSVQYVFAIGPTRHLIQPQKNYCFTTMTSLQVSLSELIKQRIQTNKNNKVNVLIKGSRSAGMESIVAHLLTQFKEPSVC